jgi:hypothetical protein
MVQFGQSWRKLEGPPRRGVGAGAQVVRPSVAPYCSSGAPLDALAVEAAGRGGGLPGKYALTQQLRAGEVVPESGSYRVQHEPNHAAAAVVVTLIRGRRFPPCPHCTVIGFELVASHEADWRLRSLRRREQRRRRSMWRARMTQLHAILARLVWTDRRPVLGTVFARARFGRTTTQVS